MSASTPPSNDDATRRVELDQSIRRGGRAVAATHLAGQLVSLAVLTVLLRLLGPNPFGLVAMVMPLLVLSRTLTALGLNVATVQRETLSREEASTVLWITLGVGATTTGLLLALASPVAWLYGNSQLRIVTLVLAGTSLVFAAGVQQQAWLERHLRLTSLAITRLAAQTLSGVLAVGYAFSMGAEGRYGGVWTLVLQQYSELFMLAVTAWVIEPWRPSAPWRRMPVGDMLRFGRQYTTSGLFFTLGQHLDKILIGALLGERALGLYSQAFNIVMKPVVVVSTAITGVMLPALSRARADHVAYQELLLAFNRLVTIVLFPVGVGLMIVGPEVMTVLGGARWQAAGPLFRTLAAVILVQGFINIAGSAFASVGQSRRLMRGAVWLTLGSLTGLLVGLALGTAMGSRLMGVTVGYAAMLVGVMFLPYQIYCLRTVHVALNDWRRTVWRPAISAVLMGLVVLAASAAMTATTSFGDATRLAVLVPLGVACYACLARDEVRWLVRRWLKDSEEAAVEGTG